MPVTPHELLGRLGATLRNDIGPAVGDPFARTQAFMASVILAKLAGQLATATADAQAAVDDHRTVVASLDGLLQHDCPADLAGAAAAFAGDGGDASWSRLVVALYAARDELGVARFDELLQIVRGALRARLDRALAYSS
jgi:hypothetical protein